MNIEKFWQTKNWRTDKIPEKDLIDSLLKKTFKIVPSKQSLIPYKVVVLGPENPEKEEFRKFTVDGNRGQPAVELRSPYVLLFTEREIDNVSPSISKKIKRGHPYTILKIGNDKRDKCIEIGMFSTILTELCLFHGLSTAFTLCFPLQNNPGWEKFKHILPSRPLLVMSIGYSNQKKSSVEDNEEYKPVIEDVIQWT